MAGAAMGVKLLWFHCCFKGTYERSWLFALCPLVIVTLELSFHYSKDLEIMH